VKESPPSAICHLSSIIVISFEPKARMSTA
jgi:hypothetical protein